MHFRFAKDKRIVQIFLVFRRNIYGIIRKLFIFRRHGKRIVLVGKMNKLCTSNTAIFCVRITVQSCPCTEWKQLIFRKELKKRIENNLLFGIGLGFVYSERVDVSKEFNMVLPRCQNFKFGFFLTRNYFQ